MIEADIYGTPVEFFACRGFVDNVNIRNSISVSSRTSTGPYGKMDHSVSMNNTESTNIRITYENGKKNNYEFKGTPTVEVDDDISIIFASIAKKEAFYAVGFVNHTECGQYLTDPIMLSYSSTWRMFGEWALLTAKWIGILFAIAIVLLITIGFFAVGFTMLGTPVWAICGFIAFRKLLSRLERKMRSQYFEVMKSSFQAQPRVRDRLRRPTAA